MFLLKSSLFITLIFILPKSLEVEGGNQPLPKVVVPKTYYISLTMNDWSGFTGNVFIALEFISNTTSITLHAKELSISNIQLTTSNENTVAVNLTSDEENDFLIIEFDNQKTGNYTLDIDFSGQLQDDFIGFYKSKYFDEEGNSKFIAATQFVFTGARLAFPCFDEPTFKANFTLRIKHSANYTPLSSMPLDSSLTNNGTVTTMFMQTPKMSTYMFGYALVDFPHTSSSTTPVRTFAREKASQATEFSVELLDAMVNAFTNYIGVDYSLPKLDSILIPNFTLSGLANWGLISFRESSVLFHPNTTSSTETQIVNTLAHEVIHMWFTGLVTPLRWDDLWIFEGLTYFYEVYAVDLVLPKWKVHEVFVYSTLQNICQNYVEDTPEINSVDFDTDGYYRKSYVFSCVLRMIKHAITEETFKKGVRKYIEDNSYSHANESDLLDAFEKVMPQENSLPTSITTIISSWTTQEGFPFLTVTRNYSAGTISIKQQRYHNTNQSTNELWWIPYNFYTASSTNLNRTTALGWISDTQFTISQTNDSKWLEDEFIIFNNQATGYYRVLYDDTNYGLITKELIDGDLRNILPTTRSQLIDDAFNFAKTGRLSYSVVMDLISYLHRETEYVPWASAFKGLEYLHRIFAGSDEYDKLKDFTLAQVGNVFNAIGILDLGKEEPHFQKETRILATNWACEMGSDKCLQTTNEHLLNSPEIHHNMKLAIYCNGVRSSNEGGATLLKNLLKNSTDIHERTNLLKALGCSQNKDILFSYLMSSILIGDPDGWKLSQDEKYRLFSSVLDNKSFGLKTVLSFLLNNLEKAAQIYGDDHINDAFIHVASRIVHDDMEAEFEAILNEALEKNLILQRTNTTIYEILEENKNWRKLYMKSIEGWLNYNSNSGTIAEPMWFLVTNLICFIIYLNQ